MLLHFWDVKPRGHRVLALLCKPLWQRRFRNPVQLPLPQALAHRSYMLCEWLDFRIGQQGDAAQFDNLWIVASQSIMISEKHMHCDASHKLTCMQRVQMKVSSWHSSWHFTWCLDGSVWSGCRDIPWLARIIFSWPFHICCMSLSLIEGGLFVCWSWLLSAATTSGIAHWGSNYINSAIVHSNVFSVLAARLLLGQSGHDFL